MGGPAILGFVLALPVVVAAAVAVYIVALKHALNR